MCAQLQHFNICKETGVKLRKKHWYEHVPKLIETRQAGKVTILWNQQVQTDGTVPSNKPDIIIHDNEKGTCMLIDVAVLGGRNVIKKETEKILKYNRSTVHVECKNKCGTSNNRGNWNYLTIIQKIPEQHIVKAQNRGTTENSHIGHSTPSLESTNVKVQYCRFNIGNSNIYDPLS